MPYIQVKTERTGETGTDWDTSNAYESVEFGQGRAVAINVTVKKCDGLL